MTYEEAIAKGGEIIAGLGRKEPVFAKRDKVMFGLGIAEFIAQTYDKPRPEVTKAMVAAGRKVRGY